MITAQEWWNIINLYSTQIWPIQAIFYVIAIFITIWFLLKPGRVLDNVIKLYLLISFAWIGIAFFMILAKDITGHTYGNYFFGIIFIIVSILFGFDLFKKKMHFSLPTNKLQKKITVILMLLVLCYPVIGIILRHHLFELIIVGTYPCPTTAYGLIMITTAFPQVNKIAYIILLLWAIPFAPFIQIPQYGVFEDIIMFIVGVYGLCMLRIYSKKQISDTI